MSEPQGQVVGVTPFATIQSAYPTIMPIGYPGMPATMTTFDAESYIFDHAATGVLGFARAVSQKAGSDTEVTLGGTAALFRGVTYRDITLLPRSDGLVGYAPGITAGVMTRGDIWVDVFEAVLASDPVGFDTATGRFGKSGIKVNGQWMRGQGTIGGLALLRLNHPSVAPAAGP